MFVVLFFLSVFSFSSLLECCDENAGQEAIFAACVPLPPSESHAFPLFCSQSVIFLPALFLFPSSFLICKFENPCIFYSISSPLPFFLLKGVSFAALSHSYGVYSSLSNLIYLSIFIFHRTPVTLLSFHPRSRVPTVGLQHFSFCSFPPYSLILVFNMHSS